MKAKVSIVIPVYNMERYLEECIESLVNQTFQEIELIFINDGSKDSSIDILRKYELLDNRILVIDKKNEGVSVARNTGITLAQGEYIMFVDPDDWIDLAYIEIMYQRIWKYAADMVICGLVQCYRNNKIPRKIVEKESCFSLNDMEIRNLENFDITASSVNKLYRKSLLDEEEMYPKDIIMAEDLVFNRKIFLKCNKIVLLPNLLYMNRQRMSSACHCVNDRSRIDNIILAANVMDQYKISVTNDETLVAWNNVPSLLLLTLLQAIILQNDKRDKEYLKYLCKQSDFWKYMNRLKYTDFRRTLKMKLLRGVLKIRLYSMCLLIAKTYAKFKKNSKVNEGYL